MLSWVEHEKSFINSGPGRVAQSVERLTGESQVMGLIPGPAIYFRENGP